MIVLPLVPTQQYKNKTIGIRYPSCIQSKENRDIVHLVFLIIRISIAVWFLKQNGNTYPIDNTISLQIGTVFSVFCRHGTVVDVINDVLIITTSPPPPRTIRSRTIPSPAVVVGFGNVWCSAS